MCLASSTVGISNVKQHLWKQKWLKNKSEKKELKLQFFSVALVHFSDQKWNSQKYLLIKTDESILAPP